MDVVANVEKSASIITGDLSQRLKPMKCYHPWPLVAPLLCFMLYLQKDLQNQPLKLQMEVWQSPWWWFHVHQQPLHLPQGGGSLRHVSHQHQQRIHMPRKMSHTFQQVLCSVTRVRREAGWSPGYSVHTVQCNKRRPWIVTAPKWTQK